jgi:S1-C subfamily serine protease
MNKKNIRTISIAAVCIITCLIIIMNSFLYSYFCKHRVYTELSDRISEEILLANIKIIQKTDKGESLTSYSTGFDGVIFKRTGNKYYALTAYHALGSLSNTRFITLAYNDQTHREYISAGGTYVGLEEYYKQFPIATVEYYDKQYDLAILSFESKSNFKTLDILDVAPKYGDKVVVISSPYGEKRNMITYGKITSRSPVKFNDKTGYDNDEHKMVKHSAYINKGSSGSVVMNKDFQIVGINLGGGTNLFGSFGYGIAMPSDKINDFIVKWNNSQQ